MKIRCLMMFKDEDDLLTPWAHYHGARFGHENLRLFDNGSTSPRTREQIAALRRQGVAIDQSHGKTTDFLDKGDLFASVIRRMDATDPADFYLPLDCDEFVGVQAGERVAFGARDIKDALAPYADHDGPLAIAMAYQNIPGSRDRFRPAFGAQTKIFFPRDSCRSLDHGFHSGVGRTPGPALATPLVHVHYHNKPLRLLQQHARQKLAAVTTNFRPAALADLVAARGPGWHLAGYLELRDEAEYRAGFDSGMSLPLPELLRAFRAIGCEPPFSPGR